MNLQPKLDGEFVSLRPLVTEDFSKLFEVASDPLIWEQHPASNRFQRPIFEKFFAMAMESRGALLVIDRKSGAAIGSSRYHGLDEGKSRVIIGYTFLARSYWGHTFNREMKKLMLDHAFESVRTVVFQIGAENLRSRKAIEKIGAHLVPAGGPRAEDGKTQLLYEIESGQEAWYR